MNRAELAAVWPPTAAVSAAAGHAQLSPVEAIRRKCLDCCGGQFTEVRLCEAVTCTLWPFRAGRHPFTKKRLQEADPDEQSAEGTPMAPACPSSAIGPQEAVHAESGDIAGLGPEAATTAGRNG